MENKTHKIWVIALIIACILLLANTAYAIWGCEDNKGNILTLISGWISGIATAFIGVITIIQTKKYKAEADDSLEKQYQFETAKLIIASRTTWIQEAKDQIKHFVVEYDCRSLLAKLREIDTLNNPTIKTVQQNHIEIEVGYFYNGIANKCNQLLSMLDRDCVHSQEKSNLKDSIIQYSNRAKDISQINFNMVNNTIMPLYNDLFNSFMQYSISLDVDLENSIDKIRDTSFIVNHYSPKRNETLE